MGRPKKPRFVRFDPDVVYFKPRGVPLSSLGEVKLAVEELEALRLKDLEGLEQTEAAKKMKVSQSTFQRILIKARKKISRALIKGRAIKIKGGDYIMPRFRPGTGMGTGRGAGGRGRMGGPYAAGPGGACQCTNPKCCYTIPHQVGVPCMQTKCPKCGSPMVRKM